MKWREVRIRTKTMFGGEKMGALKKDSRAVRLRKNFKVKLGFSVCDFEELWISRARKPTIFSLSLSVLASFWIVRGSVAGLSPLSAKLRSSNRCWWTRTKLHLLGLLQSWNLLSYPKTPKQTHGIFVSYFMALAFLAWMCSKTRCKWAKDGAKSPYPGEDKEMKFEVSLEKADFREVFSK